MPHISVTGLTKTFLDDKAINTAFSDLSLEISPGEFVCILGPSGCGKSTFLRILAGIEKPSSGSIHYRNQIGSITPTVGMVFQEHALFPWMTLQKNIEFLIKNNPLRAANATEISYHYINKVGLSEFAGFYPHQVSGGMRQRVSIARSFAYEPDILLMDEPFVFLDLQTRWLLQQMLLQIWAESRKTIIFVTHDVDEAVFMADRIIVLTAHPGTIKTTLAIDFPRPRDVLALKRNQRYGNLVADLAALIREESILP